MLASPGRRSEDVLGFSEDLAWVIDGASGLIEDIASGWDSDARWYAERLSAAIGQMSGDRSSLSELLKAAIDAVRLEAMEAWSHIPAIPPSAAVTLVRGVGDVVDYLVLADCTVVTHGSDGIKVRVDDRADTGNTAAYEALRTELNKSGNFVRARAAAEPFLRERRRSAMNVVGGYWVASFAPEAVDHAIVGREERVDTVLLASDGFARAVQPLGVYPTWEPILSSQLPLSDVGDRIREAERADGDCIRHPRWNIHDDLSAIRLRLP